MAYSGERDGATLWSDREFLDNFCTVFVNFVSRLNGSNVSVPRLLVTVRVFCQLKTASKCTQIYRLWEQKNDFLEVIWYGEEGPGRAAAPPSLLIAVPNVTAHPSTASVQTSYHSMWHYNCLCSIKG